MRNADMPAMPADGSMLIHANSAHGFSKREECAIRIVGSIMASGDVDLTNALSSKPAQEFLVQGATSIADALLAELERTK